MSSDYSNRDVFTKRKAGELDEAYQIALKLNAEPSPDEWDRRALAWCLVDLLKREFAAGHHQALEPYRQQLERIKIDSKTDEILAGQREKALLLCDPSAPLISQAQAYSKQQNYSKAVDFYNKVYPDLSPVYHESFGWDLYRYSQQLYKDGARNFFHVKKNLKQYLKLHIAKPSLLHSVILQIALKMAKDGHVDLYSLLNLWGVDNFRHDDFQRNNRNGIQYPSLYESVIQCIGKDTVQNRNIDQMKSVIPLLDGAIERYEDNIWLVFYKAKLLLGLGWQDEAKQYCRTVCKANLGASWAWQLLGEAYHQDRQCALSCFCKGLLCPTDDKYTVNLRSKLAVILAELKYYAQAKFEINKYSSLNPKAYSEDLRALSSQDWFKDVSPTISNTEFYRANKGAAEDLLINDLPWMEAVVGGKFTKPKKENRIYRTIFIKELHFVVERSCLEKNIPFTDPKEGDPIEVKGESDQRGIHQIYSCRRRDDGHPWDIFTEMIGVVTFVNTDKRVYNIIVKRGMESFIHFDKIDSRFSEGSFVNVRVARYYDSQGEKDRIISAAHTDKTPSPEIYKEYLDTINIPDNMEIGFTANSNIFIPPHLVRSEYLSDGDTISGNAILSYNKKKAQWSWKAISAKMVANSFPDDNAE